jgi:hypothetical protein
MISCSTCCCCHATTTITFNAISKRNTRAVIECRASKSSLRRGSVIIPPCSNFFLSYKRDLVFTSFGEILLHSAMIGMTRQSDCIGWIQNHCSESIHRELKRVIGGPPIRMSNHPLSLFDELTIADDLMEYSEIEFTMFLETNAVSFPSYATRGDHKE